MTSFEQLLRDSEARLTARIDEVKSDVADVREDLADAKKALSEATQFQSTFQGVARTLMWAVIVVGTLVGIYAALHGGISSGGKTP